jgi:hypothetical protein
MRDTKITDQGDFVLGRGQQMGRILWTKHFCRMRVEGDDDRCSIGGMGVTRGGGNDGLMSKMHAVEDPNREKYWSTQLRQLGDGMKRFQKRNDG